MKWAGTCGEGNGIWVKENGTGVVVVTWGWGGWGWTGGGEVAESVGWSWRVRWNAEAGW